VDQFTVDSSVADGSQKLGDHRIHTNSADDLVVGQPRPMNESKPHFLERCFRYVSEVVPNKGAKPSLLDVY
jgi:hypothetical protein